MPILTPVPFEDDDKLQIAQIAFRISQLGERGQDIPEHELDDAIFWVEAGIEDIRGTQKYDPEAYARGTMKTVLAEYAAARLSGLDPYETQGYIVAYNRWLKAAAQQRYDNRPNSWREYPKVEQRLRNREFGRFDPNGQTEADF